MDVALYGGIRKKLKLLVIEMSKKQPDEGFNWVVSLPSGDTDSLSIDTINLWLEVMDAYNAQSAVRWGEALPLCNAVWKEMK